jgi:hypothetical protein
MARTVIGSVLRPFGFGMIAAGLSNMITGTTGLPIVLFGATVLVAGVGFAEHNLRRETVEAEA